MRLLPITLATLMFSAAHAQDQNKGRDAQGVQRGVDDGEPIRITINSEARISASMSVQLSHPVACGTPLDFNVKILNLSFITSPLEAQLVKAVPDGASLEFSAEPLKGVREETRVLRLILQKPGPVDITIAFRAKNEIRDLSNRDRVHILVSCFSKR